MYLAAFSTTSLSLSIFHSQISQEISKKYKNRSVNIMSEINTIKNRLFISCLLCCRFWPMGGGNSCRLLLCPFEDSQLQRNFAGTLQKSQHYNQSSYKTTTKQLSMAKKNQLID